MRVLVGHYLAITIDYYIIYLLFLFLSFFCIFVVIYFFIPCTFS